MVYVVNNKVVIKVGDNAELSKYEKEKYLFNLIRRETTLKVPKVIAIDNSMTILPFKYGLYEYLYGDQLNEVWPKLSKRQRKLVAYDLGLSLGKIHSINYRYVEKKGLNLADWRKIIFNMYDTSMQEIKVHNLMPNNTVKEIELYIKKNTYLLDKIFKLVLLHSDYNARNILVKNNRVSGVLDMEWSFWGHSEFDLSTINRKIIRLISNYKPYFYRGYETIVKRPKDYFKYEIYYGIIYFLNMVCWAYNNKMSCNVYIEEIQKLLKKKISEIKDN